MTPLLELLATFRPPQPLLDYLNGHKKMSAEARGWLSFFPHWEAWVAAIEQRASDEDERLLAELIEMFDGIVITEVTPEVAEMTKYTTIADITGSDEFLALNPELRSKPVKQEKTDARKELEKEIRETFKRQFEAVWARCGGPALKPEHNFDEERKWAADYFLETPNGQKIIIELDGGVWTSGRHNRAGGFINDCIKLNAAALLGYRVIRIPTGFATDNYLTEIIERIKEKL